MVDLWMPGAERLTPSQPGGTPLGRAPARVVWHTTEGNTFDGNVAWLRKQHSEPHLLWDPASGRIGQFFPADRSGRALRNDGTDRTNRTGKYTIQIEVIGKAAEAPLKNSPMKGLDKILDWLDSLGIERTWPAGLPPAPSSKTYGVGSAYRQRTVWRTKGGHYGHCHVPNNTHNDPGLIDPARFTKETTVTVKASKAGPVLKHSGKVGATTMIKTPLTAPVTVLGNGTQYTVGTIVLPDDGEYIVTLQVRMPAGGTEDAEAELVRIGWPEKGKNDSTGHNPVPRAKKFFGIWKRWRTPIEHVLSGGGPVEARILMPPGKPAEMRFVLKAKRIA